MGTYPFYFLLFFCIWLIFSVSMYCLPLRSYLTLSLDGWYSTRRNHFLIGILSWQKEDRVQLGWSWSHSGFYIMRAMQQTSPFAQGFHISNTHTQISSLATFCIPLPLGMPHSLPPLPSTPVISEGTVRTMGGIAFVSKVAVRVTPFLLCWLPISWGKQNLLIYIHLFPKVQQTQTNREA